MTRLLLISGSLRSDSFNTRLLQDLTQRFDGAASADLLLPDQARLPIFDQDLETNPEVVAQVTSLHQRFVDSDGIIVSSPEHNGQPSSYTKNLVDWISRLAYLDPSFNNPFKGKPVLLCSASTGWSGGAISIPHARALFGYVGAMVLGHTICIPHVDQAWVGGFYMFEPAFDSHINEAIQYLTQQAHNFQQTRLTKAKA